VLHDEGEPFLIVGPQGVSKTTSAQQYVLARTGIREPTLLGLPVAVDPRPVVYLAMDRPRQIVRSFRRMVSEADREVLDERVRFWFGALPFDVVQTPEAMLPWLLTEFGDVGMVVVDSYKDLAAGLSSEETGQAVNAASQAVVAEGIEWVGLHHHRKAQATNKAPRALSDVYGSVWLTAGAGSVLMLWGEPGAEIVQGVHLKQPAEIVGPLTIAVTHPTGTVAAILSVAGTDGDGDAADAAGQLSERQAQIVAALIGSDGIGFGPHPTQAFMTLLDVSDKTALADLNALAERGLIISEATPGRPTTWTWKGSA
jgi:hypothetical protein